MLLSSWKWPFGKESWKGTRQTSYALKLFVWHVSSATVVNVGKGCLLQHCLEELKSLEDCREFSWGRKFIRQLLEWISSEFWNVHGRDVLKWTEEGIVCWMVFTFQTFSYKSSPPCSFPRYPLYSSWQLHLFSIIALWVGCGWKVSGSHCQSTSVAVRGSSLVGSISL